jgi:hypothetical protein
MAYFKDELPRTETFRLLLSCVPIGMMKKFHGQQQSLFHFLLWMYLTRITTWQLQVSIVATTKTVPFYVLDVSN